MAEIPEGYQFIPEEEQKKAKAFFDKGRTVAETGNFDFAIEMMIEGLKRDPDAIDAHQFLRDISLKRKASGGKDLGMFDRNRLKDTKDDRESLINREKLLAFDPGNVDHMLEMAKRAFNAGFYDTVMWIGPICFRAIHDSGKLDYKKFLALAGLYEQLKQWQLATDATDAAAKLRPDDMDLAKRRKDLAAYQTMDQGKYSSGSSFRNSVRDSSKQQDLMEADKDIRSVEGMRRQIEAAERDLASSPDDTGKIMKLVEALVKTEDPDFESRAIEKLEEVYKKTRAFRFRARIGEIQIKQMMRMERSLRDMAKANPADKQAEQDYREFQRDRVTFELGEFQLAAENYPTETKLKFEVASRLFALQKYDEAIPSLQQARQDPKYKAEATVYLGRSFFEAGFLDEALDTFEQIISEYQMKGDDKSKEMYYWRGRTLEAREQFDPAIKSYSQVAQWDFNYRDVQTRIKALRARPK